MNRFLQKDPTPVRGYGLALTMALALAVRLAYVWLQVNLGFFSVALKAPDSERYLRAAQNLLNQGSYSINGTHPSATDMPLYPIVLAPFRALFGENLTPLYFFQAFLSTATVWVVYLLGREIFGNRAGVWAALLAALSPLGFLFCASPLSEVVYTFWVVCFAALYVRSPRHWAYALAAGLAGGLAILTRPILTGFILIVCVLGWSKRGKRKRAALIFAGLTICLLPWTARNWQAFGEFIPLTDRAGFEFYLGNARSATGGSGGHLVWGKDIKMPEAKPPGVSHNQWSHELFRRALSDMAQDPARLLYLIPKKVWNMWRPTWEGASLRNWVFIGGPYILVWILALYGLGDWDLRGKGKFLWGLLFFHAAVHVLIFGIIRYRIPVEPACIVLAGGSLAKLLPSRRRRL